MIKKYLFPIFSVFVVSVLLVSRLYFPCNVRGETCNTFKFTRFDLKTQYIGEGADDLEYMGFMGISSKNLREFKHPFSNNNYFRYPKGFDYSFGFDALLPVVLGSLLLGLFKLNIAYTTTVFVILLTNYVLSLIFFKKIQNLGTFNLNNYFAWLKVIVASIVFSLSPYVFARASSHLNLLFVGGFPMLIFSVLIILKLYREGKEVRFKEYALFYLSILLVSFGSLQYLFLIFYTLLLLSVPLYLLNRKSFNLGKFIRDIVFNKGFLVSTIGFIAVFYSFFYGYVNSILLGGISLNHSRDKVFRLHLVDYLIPNSYISSIYRYINNSSISIEKVVSLGLVSLVVTILVLYSKSVFRYLKLSIVFLLGIWFALGLVGWGLPFFPEVGRLTVLVGLFVSLGVLYTNYSRWVYVLLIALLLAERLTFSLHISGLPDYSFLNNHSKSNSESLLIIPTLKYDSKRSVVPYLTQKKIYGGYFHYTADTKLSNENFSVNSSLKYFNCNSERGIKNSTGFNGLDLYKADNELFTNGTSNIAVYKQPSVFSYWSLENCAVVNSFWQNYSIPTIYLHDSDGNVSTSEVVLSSVDSRVGIVALVPGELILTGALAYPDTNKSLSVGGDNVYNPTTSINGLVQYQINGDYRKQMQSGDTIYIDIQKTEPSVQNFKIYYVYNSNSNNNQEVKIRSKYLTKVYSDSYVDLFEVKWE